MDQRVKLTSQVLVLEHDTQCLAAIREFCAANDLQPLRVATEHALEVLQSGLDLGGVLLSEHFGQRPRAGLELAQRIHALRCELPIFLRRDNGCELQDIALPARRCVSAVYTLATLDLLRPAIQSHIFSLAYPNSVVRGVMEQSHKVLEHQFQPCQIELAAPVMAHERRMQGEVFTLIPIDNHWCNGYMLLQAPEHALHAWVKRAAGEQSPSAAPAHGCQHLNQVLGETAHRLVSAFKNSFLHQGLARSRNSSMPVVIHQNQRYISIGSDNPQLCFKYTLSDPHSSICPLPLQQKLVFDLNWSPEVFAQDHSSADMWMRNGVLQRC